MANNGLRFVLAVCCCVSMGLLVSRNMGNSDRCILCCSYMYGPLVLYLCCVCTYVYSLCHLCVHAASIMPGRSRVEGRSYGLPTALWRSISLAARFGKCGSRGTLLEGVEATHFSCVHTSYVHTCGHTCLVNTYHITHPNVSNNTYNKGLRRLSKQDKRQD